VRENIVPFKQRLENIIINCAIKRRKRDCLFTANVCVKQDAWSNPWPFKPCGKKSIILKFKFGIERYTQSNKEKEKREKDLAASLLFE